MTDFDSVKSIITRDYLERLNSHVQDGYVVRHETKLPAFNLVRLKHMSNGNEIVIKADYEHMCLTQKTNKILKYICTYDDLLK